MIVFGMNFRVYLKVELIGFADVLDMSNCVKWWYHLLKWEMLWEEQLYVYGKHKSFVVDSYFGNA